MDTFLYFLLLTLTFVVGVSLIVGSFLGIAYLAVWIDEYILVKRYGWNEKLALVVATIIAVVPICVIMAALLTLLSM